MLLHHNTHVHTFVGGSGRQGSFVAENHGPIGTFSYEIILTATDSSGLQVEHERQRRPSPATRRRRPRRPALTATAAGSEPIDLRWAASTDNVGVDRLSRRALPRARAAPNFAEIAAPAARRSATRRSRRRRRYRYRVRAADASGNLGGYSTVADATTDAPPPAPPGLVGGVGVRRGHGHHHGRRIGQRQHRHDHRRDLDDAGPLRQRAELQRREQRGAGGELAVARTCGRR